MGITDQKRSGALYNRSKMVISFLDPKRPDTNLKKKNSTLYQTFYPVLKKTFNYETFKLSKTNFRSCHIIRRKMT